MNHITWLERASMHFLRLALAAVYGWFGVMKLFDLCPLADFIGRSVFFVPQGPFLILLGCWEVAIAVCLLTPRLMRPGLWLILLHLPGTLLPLIVLSGECFTQFPFGLTLAGQYIVKNLVLAGAALSLLARCQRRVVRPQPAPVHAARVPQLGHGHRRAAASERETKQRVASGRTPVRVP